MCAQIQEDPFTHLALAVLGSRQNFSEWRFAMMNGYFDESYADWKDDAGKQHTFTFVCGFVASPEQWEKFGLAWRVYLDQYEIQDFHLVDYCASANEFKKWNGEEFKEIRAQFMADAANIVNRHVSLAIACGIAKSVFEYANTIYRLEECFGSSYGLLGRTCAELALEHGIKNQVFSKYVFEDGEVDRMGLIRSMTTLKPPSLPVPIFEPGKTWKSSSDWPLGREPLLQLQSADYLAYEVRKMFADQVQQYPIRPVRSSLKAISGIPLKKSMLSPDDVEIMCRRLGVPKRH